MESGTGRGSKVEGITVCGKTGTVENYYRGVKQPNHSFFAAFAPRENPKIAIMCVVENSGRYGGTYAGPIVSLMIEKYINDSIAPGRKALETRITNTNLIPPLMKQKMNSIDSTKKVKEIEKQLIQNSISLSGPVNDMDQKIVKMNKSKVPAQPSGTNNYLLNTLAMILPEKNYFPISLKPISK